MAGSGATAGNASSGYMPPRPHATAGPASGCAAMPYSSTAAGLRNIQPDQGGEFSRNFPWTEHLRRANWEHFRNSSFRGCQEKVGGSVVITPFAH